ncbi:Rgr1p NDAI_0C06550 [Naumovozyma dairenensis CBS 421]|uniref:Mediator of RNA polymerase II transcription subunit 14 n=1 Tax=Naumovozyma dairenensis (strain ATCC 10597 / BCRC 20456 / CBS 421 / NBRC 0211 / NRRL Y-12639) TaxID=1071378 RepID=G0W953_NAUDC|nr:hypothetical protein NDAI_0C06550 [Naumovozyma dairenensis CBS 421]CCD24314.1 hypothetical protein NDAI_0C06550 [Naumovozyma dairenensis CBS 421]
MSTELDTSTSKMLKGDGFPNGTGGTVKQNQSGTLEPSNSNTPNTNGNDDSIPSTAATTDPLIHQGNINPQLKSPRASVMSSNANMNDNPDSDLKPNHHHQRYQTPPPIPHVEINQVPMSLIVRNITIFTIKEISQFMKTNLHTDPSSPSSSSSIKKMNFLKLIIFLRNQFLKLYVLIKWTRTIKNNNFNNMIDLLNWFRTTNMLVNNCIWSLKGNLTSMANAKLPNVDLVSALEVLSLGRTNLPTHDFKLSGESNNTFLKIPNDLILKKLKDLNLLVSIKISLMDIPKQFDNDYFIANGRIYLKVENEFQIQLSTIDRHSPLFFVDLNLLLTNFELTVPNKQRLEKLINEILLKNPKPLFALYQFLHKYVITLQLYSINLELSRLENFGKFSGGNLIHSYDSKKCLISIRYWLQNKMKNMGKIIIGVDKKTDNLILKWDNNNAKESKGMSTTYTNISTNLESILDEIMYNHCQLIKSDLLARDIFLEDDENNDVLLFQIPTTCLSMSSIQLKIDLISGVFFFKNPTPFLSNYIQQMNRASSIEELIKVLHRLKLDKIKNILHNMFEKTGWICSKTIKLDRPIKTKLNTTSESQILQHDMFICLPSWPVNWYLIITILSSKSSCVIEKRIGKILSIKGKWELTYLDDTNIATSKLETITYQKVLSLQNTILHRIVNHMLIDSLNQLKIRNKICSGESISSALPSYITKNKLSLSSLSSPSQDKILGDNLRQNNQESNDYTSIITLELESFLEGSKALNGILASSMFLRIDYARSEIRLYAKFKRNTMLIQCQCDDLSIHFVPHDSLAFFLSEKFTNLSLIIHHLTTFRQKLLQLVILTDVVERLHKNFSSNYFKIIELKANEISFKYLKDSSDDQDCTISIITKDQTVQNLTVKLAPSNPQHIIQPFIDASHLDYHFIFSYLQFTSSLFSTFKNILNERDANGNRPVRFTTVNLGLHNLNEYQLVYCNREAGTKITIIIELKNVIHNGRRNLQFYIHFSDDEHITTKSKAYPMMHQVRNQIFMLDTKSIQNGLNNANKLKTDCKYPNAIKLIHGISCDSTDIEPILSEIHDILKIDSNTAK